MIAAPTDRRPAPDASGLDPFRAVVIACVIMLVVWTGLMAVYAW